MVRTGQIPSLSASSGTRPQFGLCSCSDLIEFRTLRPRNCVCQLANRTQRMILRYSLPQRNIAEHPVLNSLIFTHAC
jgi:hypothetical protein